MRILSVLFLVFLGLVWGAPSYAQELFNHTGLKLPRFVSLTSGDVNARKGPGKKYPIAWEYIRKNLPVEITSEYEHWRKIKDADGDESWVHKSLLSGKRYAYVPFQQKALMYKSDSKEAPKIAEIEDNNILEILSCKENWCHVSVQNYSGWVLKTDIYGVYASETFN